MARFIITGEYKNKATQDAKKDLKSLGKETSSVSKLTKKLYAAATAAASYYVQKGLRASINAALEDQRTQRQLAMTLDSVSHSNLGAQMAAEANIQAMSKQYGIADDQLRPALSQLVRQTGNLTDAYGGLDLALSLSVASGNNLDTVINAIGKAYNGNYKSLRSLGFQLDDNLMKQKDTKKILQQLRTTYGQFAKNELETTQNQFNRIKTSAGEAAETIGTSLVNAMAAFLASAGGVQSVDAAMQSFAQDTADLTDAVATWATQNKISIKNTQSSWYSLVPVLGAYLDKIIQGQRETRKTATIAKIASSQIISARNAEYLALKKNKEQTDTNNDSQKKTLEQLMAEEAARKAGFTITKDIDSIQVVAAANRLQEIKDYKMAALDAAQAQYDALAKNYSALAGLWDAQKTQWELFQKAVSQGFTVPIALQIAGLTNVGGPAGNLGPGAQGAGVIPAPSVPSFAQPSQVERSVANAGQNIQVTVNAGAVGSEQYLVGLIGDALTKYTRFGNVTAPAGFL